MAGVHFLNLNTQNGMPTIIARYERALANGLGSDKGAYNPLLLDKGFQEENPKEFAKRVDIPAYDRFHMVGGFVLAFQEPVVGEFMETLLGLKSSFSDSFKKITQDSRLSRNKIKIPEFRLTELPTHPFVEVKRASGPNEYMDRRSNYKAGLTGDDAVVNDNGNVEAKAEIGPYVNDGPPESFSISTGDGIFQNVTVPSGTLTATQIAGLLPVETNVVEDGSFVIEAKALKFSPCSAGIAAKLGLDPNTDLKAPDENPFSEGEPFELEDGDFTVELFGNGKPTLEMKQGSTPIFELNEYDPNEARFSSTAHLLKFDIESELNIIVDVTGNLGANPVDKSTYWEYTAVFPLVIKAEDVPNSIVGNDQFTFQISGQPVIDNGHSILPTVITLRELTYNTIHDLNAEILRQLGDAGYELGIFNTESNTAGDGAKLYFADSWAENSATIMTVTANTRDFLAELTTTSVISGTDFVPYTGIEIVNNLNAAFTKQYFSFTNNRIRITGQEVGYWNTIKVYSAASNPEYSYVTKTLFGFNELPVLDNTVAGLGIPMISKEFHIDVLQNHVCVHPHGAAINNLLVELQTPSYTIEIQNTKEQDYLIEFI